MLPTKFHFTELSKRTEYTQKQIQSIEQIYIDHSVQLHAFREILHLKLAIEYIFVMSNVPVSNLLSQIYQDNHQLTEFLNQHSNLLHQTQ